MLEVREVSSTDKEEEEVAAPHDIFKVFMAEKKRHNSRPSKVPKLMTPYEHRYQATNTSSTHMQFKYQLNAKDYHLVSELEDYLMQGKLSLTTPAHVFTTSPIIQKNVVEKLRLQWVENGEWEVTQGTNNNKVQTQLHVLAPECPPVFCLPLQELNVTVNDDIKVSTILDTGPQIIII